MRGFRHPRSRPEIRAYSPGEDRFRAAQATVKPPSTGSTVPETKVAPIR